MQTYKELSKIITIVFCIIWALPTRVYAQQTVSYKWELIFKKTTTVDSKRLFLKRRREWMPFEIHLRIVLSSGAGCIKGGLLKQWLSFKN